MRAGDSVQHNAAVPPMGRRNSSPTQWTVLALSLGPVGQPKWVGKNVSRPVLAPQRWSLPSHGLSSLSSRPCAGLLAKLTRRFTDLRASSHHCRPTAPRRGGESISRVHLHFAPTRLIGSSERQRVLSPKIRESLSLNRPIRTLSTHSTFGTSSFSLSTSQARPPSWPV